MHVITLNGVMCSVDFADLTGQEFDQRHKEALSSCKVFTLIPIGESMAYAFAKKGSVFWLLIFAFAKHCQHLLTTGRSLAANLATVFPFHAK